MVAAVATWCGAAAGSVLGTAAVTAVMILGVVVGAASGPVAPLRRSVPWVVLLVAATVSGGAAAHRADATLGSPLPAGRVEIGGVVLDDPRSHGAEVAFPFRPERLVADGEWREWAGPTLAVRTATAAGVAAGDHVVVAGSVSARPGHLRGDPVAGTLRAARVVVVAAAPDPLFVVGNALRRRVATGLEGGRPPAATALLAGFLIGDVRALPASDAEALRLAGLSHFVAVSGSNVALFLTAWWMVAGPLGFGGRRRALLGLVGLAVFVVVTRWEPSVLRAAAMAGIVLAGRALRFPIDAWTAFGLGVAGLLLISGQLAGDVGFQLSAAATAGVMAGSGLFAGRRPTWAWSAAGATLAAQAAVFPLLLVHFGTVPLLAPLSNLIAAPLVMVSTALGGIGVVAGLSPVRDLGILGARVVLAVARAAADWPQLGWAGSLAVAAGVIASRHRQLRPAVVAVGLGCLVFAIGGRVAPPAVTTVTVLDVGEGDAILIEDPSGRLALFDGGRDPVVLWRKLRAHGVDAIDLVMVSHGDADHAGGLVDLPGRVPIGRVWVPRHAELGPQLDAVVAAAIARGIPVEEAEVGWAARLGTTAIEVLGPSRRYAADNDGSLVLLVRGPGGTMLLPGDVEAVAQRELGPVDADVLLVPHHGSATTDPGWLTASVPGVAVISVGANAYGHPHPAILELLEELGVTVLRTDEDGDVSVPLG